MSESIGDQPTSTFPKGYVGWVRIEYGLEGAPPLKRDFLGPWEYQWFPASGLLQTSSELHDGMASANYFYYSGNDKKTLPQEMINGGTISWCVIKADGSYWDKNFITYFVGPRNEYVKHQFELEQYKKSDCKYLIDSVDELPEVGNLAGQVNPGR